VVPTLTDIYLEVARRVDGSALLREAVTAHRDLLPGGRWNLLAVGKAAFPMFEGLASTAGIDRIARGLIVAPQTRFPKDWQGPARVRAIISDHPDPSARSVAAAKAARELVAGLRPDDSLVVLLSGGGSAALCAPADGLTLEDKRATTKAVARGGATIGELNTVRKHLSGIKGGQLALATQAPTVVLTLSDVVGNDPSTIASGPFSADSTTFAEALAIVRRLAPDAPASIVYRLEQGAAGALPETPKPGDPRLAHVRYAILAGPERVAAEARQAIQAAGVAIGQLSSNIEDPVPDVAALYGSRARSERSIGARPRVLVGNGEPAIVVRGHGRGGRATHLALMMAREIAGLSNVSFLAAGTDDRDGASDASGAVIDGATWARAVAAGLDPAGALERNDSATPLEAMGCLVRGPGTSNLLDVHLLAFA
jgi:hydroxypyruvate reductase